MRLRSLSLLLPITALAAPVLGRVIEVPATANLAARVKQSAGEDGVEFRIRDVGKKDGDEDVDVTLRPVGVFAPGATHVGEDGVERQAGTDLVTLVAADSETSHFAAVVVNTKTRESRGVMKEKRGGRGGGKAYKFKQSKGKKADLEAETGTFVPKAWECTEVPSPKEPKGPNEGGRALEEAGQGHKHAGYNYQTHYHDRDDRDHDHDILREVESFGEALGLRGSKARLGRRLVYYTDTFPKKYSYEVKIYMEYDAQFQIDSNINGANSDTVEEYVALLMAATNAVYEKEVDTHLNIAKLELTNRYDGASDASAALGIMRSDFSGTNFGNGVAGIDLHHALIGRSLGGGVAYLGAICDTNYGFGVSGSMNGKFESDVAAAVWDATVLMHELGHNFNARHSHDSSYGTPLVDQCGINCPSVSDGAATIMSYCHLCGGEKKIAYTFGGHRDSNGDFQNDAGIVEKGVSVESKRIPEVMHGFVSSLGQCVAPPPDRPSQVCTSDSDCSDGDMCNGDETCSGEGVCLLGQPITCQGGDFCNGFQTCNSSNGQCQATPANCDDGLACNGVETCSPLLGEAGACEAGIPPFPSVGQQVRVEVTTDNYASETSWSIKKEGSDTTIMSSQPYTNAGTLYQSQTCLDPGRYIFTINDSFGDGICCNYGNGSYKIYQDNEMTHSGGEFNSVEQKIIVVSQPTDSPTMSPINSPTASPINPPTASSTDTPTASPVNPPTASPTASPVEPPNASPTASPVDPPTASPTASPVDPSTASPTVSPVNPPTASPTASPVDPLTASPTASPIDPPTASPTASPVDPPTASPTASPIDPPTALPTASPVDPPTASPTASPVDPPTSGTACPGQMTVRVDLLTDNWGYETSWDIVGTGESGSGYASLTSYSMTCCLDYGLYQFKISDSFGDGIYNPPGKFEVYVDDDLQVSGMESFGTESVFDIGICEPGNKLFELKLTTDNFGGETTWALNKNGGSVFTGGPYSSSNKYDHVRRCVPDDCYEFVIEDSWGDGICCNYGEGSYELVYDSALIHSGGAFGSSETTTLGSNCPASLNTGLGAPKGLETMNARGRKKTAAEKAREFRKAEKARLDRIEKKLKGAKGIKGKNF